MWLKPWTLKESFTIGAGLIIMGLMLQLSVGPVIWDSCNWPSNIIALLVFLVFILAVCLLRKKVYFFNFIGTIQSAIPILIYAVILTIIMGLCVQTVNGGHWFNNMLSFWPFVLIYVYLDFIIGVVVFNQLNRWIKFFMHRGKGKFPFSLLYSSFFHIGLFMTLTFATLGNVDMQRLNVIAETGHAENRGIDNEGNIKKLDISIELKKFTMETYDDGTPRRFASDIDIYSNDGRSLTTTVEVNKPAVFDGWKIFQAGYDPRTGPYSQISILEVIRDPWIGWVYAGIYLMLAGAAIMFFFAGKASKTKKNFTTTP